MAIGRRLGGGSGIRRVYMCADSEYVFGGGTLFPKTLKWLRLHQRGRIDGRDVWELFLEKLSGAVDKKKAHKHKLFGPVALGTTPGSSQGQAFFARYIRFPPGGTPGRNGSRFNMITNIQKRLHGTMGGRKPPTH